MHPNPKPNPNPYLKPKPKPNPNPNPKPNPHPEPEPLTNYEALLADLGGRSITRSSCGADTVRTTPRHDQHGHGESLKRRR